MGDRNTNDTADSFYITLVGKGGGTEDHVLHSPLHFEGEHTQWEMAVAELHYPEQEKCYKANLTEQNKKIEFSTKCEAWCNYKQVKYNRPSGTEFLSLFAQEVLFYGRKFYIDLNEYNSCLKYP